MHGLPSKSFPAGYLRLLPHFYLPQQKAFLEDNGVEVLGMMGEQCLKDQEICRVSPERFVEMHLEMYRQHPDVDACFISCTNSRTIEAIPVLEQHLG